MSPSTKETRLPVRIAQIADRFWERVDLSDPDGCWDWTSTTNTSGPGRYGIISIRNKKWYVHRVVACAIFGSIPPGHEVRHSCDNRLCVRPAHLSLGTRADNMRDLAERERGSNRTDTAVVRRALALAESGMTQRAIAAELGVSQSGVGRWIRGVTRPSITRMGRR